MKRLPRTEDNNDIELTPMLDVVFILLIFFVMTTSFVKETGIDINRPSTVTAEKKPQGNILIAISAKGDIWIDNREIDVRAVRANIQQLKARYSHSSVIIQSDVESTTGVLIKVMDQVRLAGIENISIAASLDSQ